MEIKAPSTFGKRMLVLCVCMSVRWYWKSVNIERKIPKINTELVKRTENLSLQTSDLFRLIDARRKATTMSERKRERDRKKNEKCGIKPPTNPTTIRKQRSYSNNMFAANPVFMINYRLEIEIEMDTNSLLPALEKSIRVGVTCVYICYTYTQQMPVNDKFEFIYCGNCMRFIRVAYCKANRAKRHEHDTDWIQMHNLCFAPFLLFAWREFLGNIS